MPLYALPEVRPGWWGNMQRLTFTLACPNIPWTSQQSTNCVWHFWETGNHSPHESTAICNQRSWRYSHAGRSQLLSQHLWHLQGSLSVTGLQPAGPCLATNCWNTRCHHQDPRICQHFNWLAKLAPKTKGWHLLLSPVSHRHRCFGRRKGDFQKISLKEQAKINQKKTRYANTPSQNLSCVHHNNILEDICTRPLSHMDLHLPLPNFHPDATRLHKARLIGDLPPATCSGCKDRHDAECAVRNVRSSTERRRRSMFDFWHNDICFPNDRKSWGHPQSFPVSVIACKRLAA